MTSISLSDKAAAEKAQFGMRARHTLADIITYILLALFSLFVLIPFFYMFSTSLKPENQLFIWPIRWIPEPIMWENYLRAFQELSRIVPGLNFWRILGNTLFITILAMVAELIAVTLVAYGFARFRFPGRDVLFILMLSTMMLPGIITLIPIFVIWRNLGLIDTYDPLVTGIWLGGGAWAVFLLRQFLLSIPKEIEEAAIIDGANTFQIYYKIMLPLIYLNTPVKFPMVVALKFFQESLSKEAPKWHYMMAMSTLMAAPILVLFFTAQRYFIEGLTIGAVKG